MPTQKGGAQEPAFPAGSAGSSEGVPAREGGCACVRGTRGRTGRAVSNHKMGHKRAKGAGAARVQAAIYGVPETQNARVQPKARKHSRRGVLSDWLPVPLTGNHKKQQSRKRRAAERQDQRGTAFPSRLNIERRRYKDKDQASRNPRRRTRQGECQGERKKLRSDTVRHPQFQAWTMEDGLITRQDVHVGARSILRAQVTNKMRRRTNSLDSMAEPRAYREPPGPRVQGERPTTKRTHRSGFERNKTRGISAKGRGMIRTEDSGFEHNKTRGMSAKGRGMIRTEDWNDHQQMTPAQRTRRERRGRARLLRYKKRKRLLREQKKANARLLIQGKRLIKVDGLHQVSCRCFPGKVTLNDTTESKAESGEWLLDSGASHHLARSVQAGKDARPAKGHVSGLCGKRQITQYFDHKVLGRVMVAERSSLECDILSVSQLMRTTAVTGVLFDNKKGYALVTKADPSAGIMQIHIADMREGMYYVPHNKLERLHFFLERRRMRV